MESTDTKLFEAASKGSIDRLHELLKEDPIILDRSTINCFSETPLHVAALLGHVGFITEIIKLKPLLLSEVNALQSTTPLHLASVKGHVDVVRLLLEVDRQASSIRDRNRLTPLHLAALQGHTRVMEVLVDHDLGEMRVCGEENIMHLCLKRGQLEALKVLVGKIGDAKENIINSRDNDGNTLLHLAVACRELDIIEFLVDLPGLEMNATNLNGMTALDIYIPNTRETSDADIEKSLTQAGGMRMLKNRSTKNGPKKGKGKRKQSPDDWVSDKRNALMVVASLIATMAFQAGVNPPGGVWEKDGPHQIEYPNGVIFQLYAAPYAPRTSNHTSGHAIMADKFLTDYIAFNFLTTLCFLASLSIILLLMSGLPIRRKFLVGILMTITLVAVVTIALVYAISVSLLTPKWSVPKIVIPCWVVGMVLLVIACHIIRLIVMLCKKVRKKFRKRRMSRYVV